MKCQLNLDFNFLYHKNLTRIYSYKDNKNNKKCWRGAVYYVFEKGV